jgi:multiple sugar transport system permease protein
MSASAPPSGFIRPLASPRSAAAPSGHRTRPHEKAPRPLGLARVFFARLAGGAGLPVDALALAQERDRQHRLPARLHPGPPTLDNFRAVFERNDFVLRGWNSIIVSFGATGHRAAGRHAGGLRHRQDARVQGGGADPDRAHHAGLFPTSSRSSCCSSWLGLTGTLWPILITHLVLTVPIAVWVMIGFFESLPAELEEAALVDGATIWQAFRHVALPLARPGITVATSWPSSSPGTTSSSRWCSPGARPARCRSRSTTC